MKNVVFLGDSITDWGRNRGDDRFLGSGYPTLVSAKLGAEYPKQYIFLNRGISGNRIVDIYSRIRCDCINLEPDVVSILIGVNDVWHNVGVYDDNGRCYLKNNGVPNERYEQIYSMMVEDIKAANPNTEIMILEPFVRKGFSTERDYDAFVKEVFEKAAIAKKVAEKYGLTFVELQKVFDDACEIAEETYWLADGVHPTNAGHQIVADEWIKAFKNKI